MKKKFLIILAVLTITTMMGMVSAYAATSGNCGENVTWILDTKGTLTISGTGAVRDYSFRNNTNIKEVVIENNVMSIGQSAFAGNSSLTDITMSSSVTIIGKGAFSDCNSLKNVYITDLSKWCSIIFDSSASNPMLYADNLYLNGNLLTEIDIPNGVTSINSNAFVCCNCLTSAIIPDSVASVGRAAFNGCSGLTSITMPSTTTLFDMFNGVPDALTKITITSGDIPSGFATDCTNIARVNIGDNVSSIGAEAFKGCTNLRFLTLGQGVKKISQNAFNGCSNLSEITLPSSLQTIEQNAFSKCYDINEIVIPNSVTSIIGDGVFPKDTVICGYRGSAAQEYAENYGYTFRELDADEYITTSTAERINGTIVLSTSVSSDISKKTLHIALFDNNNTLVDYMVVPTKNSVDNAYVVFKNNPNVSYAKVFVWDSLKSMTPTAKAEKVIIQ